MGGQGTKVGFLGGGPLLLLASADLLPEARYRTGVLLRVAGLAWFVGLWLAIFAFFPDAPTFFEGAW